MRFRFVVAAIIGPVFCAPGILTAQPPAVAGSVTFVVPVNLTELSPDLEKVRLACGISSSALVLNPALVNASPNAEDELFVVSGQVIAALRVVIYIQTSWLRDPIGKEADYGCALEGFSKSLARWDRFTDNAPDPVFRLKPTPATIFGKFVW